MRYGNFDFMFDIEIAPIGHQYLEYRKYVVCNNGLAQVTDMIIVR